MILKVLRHITTDNVFWLTSGSIHFSNEFAIHNALDEHEKKQHSYESSNWFGKIFIVLSSKSSLYKTNTAHTKLFLFDRLVWTSNSPLHRQPWNSIVNKKKFSRALHISYSVFMCRLSRIIELLYLPKLRWTKLNLNFAQIFDDIRIWRWSIRNPDILFKRNWVNG